MKHVTSLIGTLSERLKEVAAANAVVAKPVSVGTRHVVPLCELGLSFGGGGGGGQGSTKDGQGGTGAAAAAGGGAKATPVALLVIEDGDVRLEKIGR